MSRKKTLDQPVEEQGAYAPLRLTLDLSGKSHMQVVKAVAKAIELISQHVSESKHAAQTVYRLDGCMVYATIPSDDITVIQLSHGHEACKAVNMHELTKMCKKNA